MLENLIGSMSTIVLQTQEYLPFLLKVLGVLFAIHLLNTIVQNRLLVLGIYPRHLSGIPGIIFSPFLHGNFNHLFFNAIPLFVLLDFILIYAPTTWKVVVLAILLLTGSLTWLFGRKAIHVGASGVITGFWSYLVFNMYQEASLTSVILGVLCVYYFAGIFIGIFPRDKGTSWEGHLFGLAAGIITAWSLNDAAFGPSFYNFFNRLI